ncbi:CBP1 Corticosteroid-binding protein [Candida maltosa Xu316]
MPHKKVVIIGGGMSGIKAAIDLYNAGITNTVILESQSHLGGRLSTILSENHQGTTYDLGASWFHDCLKNPLLDKVNRMETIEYFYDDGKCVYLDKKLGNVESSFFESILNEFFTFVVLSYTANPEKPDLSVKDLTFEYLEKYKDTFSSEQGDVVIGVIRMWTELWLGESWEKVSGKYTCQDSHLGRNAFVKNGFQKVFVNELRELPRWYRDSSIKLNAHVDKIDYSNNKKIIVGIKDGRSYTCDYVIVTIPQTNLKNDKVKWIPEVPPPIKKVLPEVHFGSLGKVVLEFDECFWPENVHRFYVLADDNRTDKSTTKDPKPWEYPSLLVNYQAVNNVPSLIALTQKPLSEYIESLPDSPSKDEKIWSIYKPMLSKLVGSDSIPIPKKIYHTTWNKHPLYGGSYGCPIVGAQDPSEVIDAFVNGYQGRIKFAGAETMDDSSNGCAHGAWFSGQREAAYIIAKEGKVSAKL